jgi:vacuolar-type H+-ATPase subunit E/Vma4
MAKTDTKTQKDEFSRIFDEYRAKIEEISRKTVTNPPPEEKSNDSYDQQGYDEMQVNVAKLQSKPGSARDIVSSADLEAEEIIMAARRRAQQILDEAEERSRKEASKKTQGQVEKIITKARKEAEEMVAQARQVTEKESNEIVVAAKQEAELLIREITEKARQDTQMQSSRAIDDASNRAEQMITEIIKNCEDISLMVNDVVDKTKQTITEFEAKLRTDLAELAKNISDAQQKLEKFNTTARKLKEEPRPVPPPPKNTEPLDTPTLSVRILGAKSNGQHGTQPLFSGQVEMKSISTSFDYQYLKNLKKYLVHIPNIKYVQEYASEKEISILFELKEPLPLLDILKNVPQVDNVVTNADDLNIVFKENI